MHKAGPGKSKSCRITHCVIGRELTCRFGERSRCLHRVIYRVLKSAELYILSVLPRPEGRGFTLDLIKRLIALGAHVQAAVACGMTSKGPWRSAKTPGINHALSLSYLKSEGLFSLREGWIKLHYPK